MTKFCKVARSLHLQRWVLPGCCAFTFLVPISQPMVATPLPSLLAQGLPARTPVPSQKVYIGQNSNPEICDTRDARGWFYWYVDGLQQCYIVPAASQEQAANKAAALIEESFYVIVSGYGFRDDAGNPL